MRPQTICCGAFLRQPDIASRSGLPFSPSAVAIAWARWANGWAKSRRDSSSRSTAGQQRVGVVQVLEQLVLPLDGRGEAPDDMGRDRLEQRQQLADDRRPQAVGFVDDQRPAALARQASGVHWVRSMSRSRSSVKSPASISSMPNSSATSPAISRAIVVLPVPDWPGQPERAAG